MIPAGSRPRQFAAETAAEQVPAADITALSARRGLFLRACYHTRMMRSSFSILILVAACGETGDGEATSATTTGTTSETTTGASATVTPTTTTSSEASSEATTAPTTSAATEAGTTGDPTGGDTTTGEPLTRVEQILAALDVAMYQCPERIWPDVEANYRSRQVLLASEIENKAWLWNAQQGGGVPPVVSEGPLDSLPPEWTSVFNINDLGGTLTLGISLDWTADINAQVIADGDTLWPDYATSLTFHEGMHFLSDQDDWNTGTGSRSSPYPEPWEPRYLRAQVARALLDEVESEGTGLAAAAHWQARLLAEYTAEMKAIRSYDCTEGSAEYVSLMMSALAELGCDAGDPELLALAISHLPDGIFLSEGAFDVGREPYDLGVLGGLLLRRAGAAGWELKVENGGAPVDQVIAGVTPVDQPDDPQIQADAQAAVEQRNMMVGAEVDPMLANMADPAYTRIVVSFNWVAGSFGVGGFYYLADDPNLSDVLLRLSASLEPPSGVPIEITDFTVLTAIATPCQLSGGAATVLAVPTADLSVVGGKASIGSARLDFSGLEVEATVDADNLPWLCPVDVGGAGGAPAPEPGLVLHTLRAPAHNKQGNVAPRIGVRR